MATSYIYPPTPEQKNFDSKDLNTLTQAGMYHVNYPSNDPVQGSSGYVFVKSAGDMGMQLFFGEINGDIYYRHNNGIVWGPWERLMEYRDVYYKAYNTFATSELLGCTGYVTHGADRIYLTLYVDKSLKNISTISVTTLSGSIRTVEGYAAVPPGT